MSYSDKVATFLEAPTTELDRINMDDLELIAGDIIERVRSQPNSPIGKYSVNGYLPSLKLLRICKFNEECCNRLF